MTLLIASTFVDSESQLAGALSSFHRCGADLLELRLDSYAGSTGQLRSSFSAAVAQSLLITCRTNSEGGRFAGSATAAARRVLELAEETNAHVDVALDAWREDQEIRSRVMARLNRGSRVILSAHFAGTHPPLDSLVREILQVDPRIIAKVAYAAPNAIESFTALDLMQRYGSRVAAVCMGEFGAWTRVLAKKVKAFGTYASLGENAATAPGQWNVDQLLHEFGWSRIGQDTRVLAVVGDPVAHSLGPRLFNHWFRLHGTDAVYVPIRVTRDNGGLAEFVSEIETRPWLNFDGLSVTIPHKTDALQWAGESADPMSREIDAANTLVIGSAARAAYNTDGYAAVDSLACALSRVRSDLAGLKVDILGAGGSARALCHGLSEMGCTITLYARTPPPDESFAQWATTIRNWDERTNGSGEVLINCTPIGMWPAVDQSPMPIESLRGRRLVFDLIYRPLKSKLLREAESCGSAVLSGLDMFVRQASTQFSIWMGFSPEQHTDESGDAENGAVDFLERILRTELEPQCPDHKIALIGARGAGKSSVGLLLSSLLGQRFLDTDELVSASAGKTIAEIFASEDEAGFRSREITAVHDALARMPAVLSLGGGAITSPDIVSAIRRAAHVVWLKASPEELVRRIQADPTTVRNRPSLTNLDREMETRKILEEREPKYHAAADLIVETDGHLPDEVAHRIFDWLRGEPDKRLL